MVERLEKLAIGEAIHAKREAMFFHWMAPRDVCARLSSIVAIPEVELQCVFSVFVRGLSGDVYFRRNLGKMVEDFHAKRKEFFSFGSHCATFAHVCRPF